MAFEVPQVPIAPRRRPWHLLLIGGALGLVVAIGALAGGPAGSRGPAANGGTGAEVDRGSEGAAAPGGSGSIGRPAGRPHAMPSAVACHELDRATCILLAGAALPALPGQLPVVTREDVYGTLLCRSTIDCPPGRLAAAGAPSGSVVITFADRTLPAWVNVMTHPSSAAAASAAPASASTRRPSPDLFAWLVR